MQDQHKQGIISRYEIVPLFIDFIVPDTVCYSSNPDQFANVHIITTKKNDYGFGIETVFRAPTSREDLVLLLLQTTWIPAVTGHDLWIEGHMDGGVSVTRHPRCELEFSTMVNAEVSKHAFNPYLTKETAMQFWREGLALET